MVSSLALTQVLFSLREADDRLSPCVVRDRLVADGRHYRCPSGRSSRRARPLNQAGLPSVVNPYCGVTVLFVAVAVMTEAPIRRRRLPALVSKGGAKCQWRAAGSRTRLTCCRFPCR